MPRSIVILLVGLLLIMGTYYMVMDSWSSRSTGATPIINKTQEQEKSGAKEPQRQEPQRVAPHVALQRTYETKLHMAVLAAKMNIQCGHTDSGGDTYYKPTEAADRLLKVMQATVKATTRPGSSRSPTISYTLNQVNSNWQVVIIPDDGLQRILLEGFGDMGKAPVVRQEISCR